MRACSRARVVSQPRACVFAFARVCAHVAHVQQPGFLHKSTSNQSAAAQQMNLRNFICMLFTCENKNAGPAWRAISRVSHVRALVGGRRAHWSWTHIGTLACARPQDVRRRSEQTLAQRHTHTRARTHTSCLFVSKDARPNTQHTLGRTIARTP